MKMKKATTLLLFICICLVEQSYQWSITSIAQNSFSSLSWWKPNSWFNSQNTNNNLDNQKPPQNLNNLNKRRACGYGEVSPDCDECGVFFTGTNARIVGGVEANPHSWPATTFIIFQYKANLQLSNRIVRVEKEFICGGFLADRTTVITAAHCIQDEITVKYDERTYNIKVVPNNYFSTYGSMYKVFVGLHNNLDALNDRSVAPGKQVRVDRVIKHPRFSDQTNLNDIAVLKLVEPVTLDRNIQISCLPNPDGGKFPADNVSVYAVGWGALYSEGASSNTLQNVQLTVYDGIYCDIVAPYSTKNWETQICAGEYYGGKDTCQGDSGGAIYTRDFVNGKVKFVAAGIVSYGEGCAERYKPGIYTRVSAYLPWIRSYMD